MTSPFRALGNYKILPKIVGWPSLITAFAARAPFAMIPLGVMVAFTSGPGSVVVGGLATAAVSFSTAISSPLLGRAADRWGQRALLLVLVPLNALGLLGLFATSLQTIPGWYLWPICILTGATIIPVGSFTRARWVARTTAPFQLSAAFSYESMADELVFVLGPALVGIASSAAAPSAPLGLAFVLVVAAGIPFALSAPDRQDFHATPKDLVGSPPIPGVLLKVLPAILILISVGIYFGAVQTGTTVRAELLGQAGQAGLVYAALGLGSAATALLVVMVPESFRLSLRVLISGIGMAVAVLLVNLQGTLLATALMLAFAGLWVGPTLVSAFAITERLAPAGGMSVALTSMQSSVTVGVSIGAAAGGAIASNFGAGGAYFFAILTCGVIVGVALVLQLPSFRRQFSTI